MVSRMHRTLQHTRDMYNPLVSHESLHPGITVRPQILAGLVSYLSFSLASVNPMPDNTAQSKYGISLAKITHLRLNTKFWLAAC